MEFNDVRQAQALSMATKLGKDLNLDEAESFLNSNEDKTWHENFGLLFSMLRTRDYSLSHATWAVIAGALAYVVFPMDIIPDFIPGLGWLDDAFVLATVVAMLDGEIQKFKSFIKKAKV
jgi:uncharacterized membrane protein YkvA (DUF1232 family)